MNVILFYFFQKEVEVVIREGHYLEEIWYFQPVYNMIPTSLQHYANQFTTLCQPVYNIMPTSLQHYANLFTTLSQPVYKSLELVVNML